MSASDGEQDAETDVDEPKRKRPKVLQKYLPGYQVKYPVIRHSSVSENHAYCTVCRCDFGVGHGGMGDVEKHIRTTKHVVKAGSGASCARPIQNFFTNSKDLSVIRAETLFAEFLVEHNLPLACSDHAGKLFRKMFPDSAVAAKYGSARTKTACIVESLADFDAKRIVCAMKNGPFAMATDGSNDIGAVKLYPICVRYFNAQLGKVMCVMQSLQECTEASTGENIFRILDNFMSSHNIPWQNCICFAADNASVMSGKNKGVASFLRQKVPSIYIVGCACHLMHLAAGKAASSLSVKVDELLIDVYYYLDKSSSRKQHLEQFQKLHAIDVHKILKHVSVRWLSIGICLTRLLEQWPALKEFFATEVKNKTPTVKGSRGKSTSSSHVTGSSVKSTSSSHVSGSTSTASSHVKGSSVKSGSSNQVSGTGDMSRSSGNSFDITQFLFKEQQIASAALASKASKQKVREETQSTASSCSDSRALRVHRLLSDPYTKLTCLFLQYSVPLFDDVNTVLQKEEPCIHILHSVLTQQLQKILLRFVQPAVISATSVLTSVPFKDRSKQKEDAQVTIGAEATAYIKNHEKELGCRLQQFYSEVREYYVAACTYMVSKFPYDDPLLINAQVLDITKRTESSFLQVKYFSDRFECLKPTDCSMDELEDEFLAYQVAVLPETIQTAQRIDVTWHLISSMKDPVTGARKFANLSTVMNGILVIFHSNADCERIFSMLTKNKTDMRATLATATVGSILVRKTMMNATSSTCYLTEHSQQQLHSAKSATHKHLSNATASESAPSSLSSAN